MYQLYVNSMSPFAIKASAMIGYVGLPCERKVQNLFTRFAVLKRLTGETMVPVLRRGEWAINDSTEIARFVIEQSDAPLLPRDAALSPICWILEDFADEWLSRWMLLSRWNHPEDVDEMNRGIGQEMTRGVPVVSGAVGRIASAGIQKTVDRIGANEANRAALEHSRDRFLQALEAFLDGHDAAEGEQPAGFLFEAYPTVADFALYGQLWQFAHDPSGRRHVRMYPGVCEFVARVDRMKLPRPSVDLPDARPPGVAELAPLFAEFLGTYWRVLVENHRAYHRPKRPEQVDVELLDGTTFSFRPSGYLVGRLEFVLSHLDRAYAEREELFGGEGLEIEHALVHQVARLADDADGRELLRGYPHIGKPQP